MPRISAASIDAHRNATRRALFAAAEDLFGRYGYSDTTLGGLADHAGIGRTTFYEYFSDKDDLVASLVEERLPEIFETMVRESRSLPSREQLAALAISMVEFVATDPVFGQILHQEVLRLGPKAQRRIAASHQGVISEFTRLYSEGVAAGAFRDMPHDLASRLIVDVVMSGARTLMKSEDPKQRFHEVAEETVRFLIRGLGACERA